MQTFVWVVLVIFGIGAIAKLTCLSIGYLPPRNKAATAIDVVFDVCLIVWAAILLHSA